MNASETFSAAIIVIGNEILSGRTQDTNVQWIAEKLLDRGIRIAEVRIIPDEQDVIVHTINILRAKYDHVFTTGGIGPTHDDITAQSIASAFQVDLVEDPEAYETLKNYYGPDNLTPARRKMAQVPKGSILIPNPVSAAPGFRIDNVFVLAGVPRIMQAMLDHVKDMLKQGKPILSNTVACGLGESMIADDLGDLNNRFPEVEIGSYPHYRGGVLGLSLVLRSTHIDPLDQATKELLEIIRKHGDEPRAVSMRSHDRHSFS